MYLIVLKQYRSSRPVFTLTLLINKEMYGCFKDNLDAGWNDGDKGKLYI